MVPECNSRETQLLGSTTPALQLNLIWATPWQTRSLWISPKGVPGQKMSGSAALPRALLTKDRDSEFLFKSPGERVITVIGEGFDHTYISFTDSCFQIAAHLQSTKKQQTQTKSKTKPTKTYTQWQKKNNKSLSKRKEVRKVHFHLQRLRKKVPYFSTNIKSQQIDQRMATVIKYVITAIWKGKINK